MTAAIKLAAPATEDLTQEPYYPYCDGEPMAESDLHAQAMLYCLAVLQKHFEDRPDVYVAGNNFLYYVQGQPRIVISPDCYVVFGADSQPRKSYKAWEVGGLLPSVIVEVTSASTQGSDVEHKFRLYQDVFRTAEYFLYDPTGDYIPARLLGYRLGSNGYEAMQPDAQGRLQSVQLGLHLRVENNQLRFYDPVRNYTYQPYGQEVSRADEQARRAELEAQRADTEARRADEQAYRADAETQAKVQLQAQLAADAQATAALQAELARMRAALEALQKTNTEQIQEAATLQNAGDTPQDK